MHADGDLNSLDSRSERHELIRLIRRIQNLTLELEELRRRDGDIPDLDAKERRLEQLRWRLATVARRSATDAESAA
jgi:UDP-glucose 4-epimerase